MENELKHGCLLQQGQNNFLLMLCKVRELEILCKTHEAVQVAFLNIIVSGKMSG